MHHATRPCSSSPAVTLLLAIGVVLSAGLSESIGRLEAAEPYESPFSYDDPRPQAYRLSERASVVDPRAKAHPEIHFPLDKDGQPKDVQSAYIDTRVPPRGRLVVALTGGGRLFSLTQELGLHAVRIPYADGWFNLFSRGEPRETWRGDIRLEAATGEDFSPLVDIPRPDGLEERTYRFVQWLAEKNPQAKWDRFLTPDGKELRWDLVTLVGLSHGSTTAARFALHRKVDRVICFSGPRDQDQSWQAGRSATPSNRFFMFTGHDSGWTAKHYCRSWELLGLHAHGPIVDVDRVPPPYGNTRRLVTSVSGKGKMAIHNGVAPNDFAHKDADGKYLHEAVWRYLFVHPVDRTGEATDLDPTCQKAK